MSTLEEGISLKTGQGCPVDHKNLSHQKTVRSKEETEGPKVEVDAAGVWHIRGFEEARFILRHPDTKQAGFKAEVIDKVPGMVNKAILYLEGPAHNQQRKQTARFFTPKTVSSNYEQLMINLVDELI